MVLASPLRREDQQQVPGMYVVLHAGTRNGFVSGASLIFVAGTR
jgi:hypothetical protein